MIISNLNRLDRWRRIMGRAIRANTWMVAWVLDSKRDEKFKADKARAPVVLFSNKRFINKIVNTT